MKYALLLAVIATILHSTWSQDDVMKGVQEKCKNEFPVSQAVMNRLLNHELLEDKTLKEYTFCLYKSIGFQEQDGSFKPESMRAVAHSIKGDHALESLIIHCASSSSDNGPDNAWSWLICMKQSINPNMFYALCNRFWGFQM